MNVHLWSQFESSAIAMNSDLANVRFLKLYNGGEQSVLGDVYLQSAIAKAEDILNYLKTAQRRRDEWIDMHQNKSFWLEEAIKNDL